MNERYLHHIWNKKRLPFHKINTVTNDSIEVLHIGEYNERESGPDFSMAKIRIDKLIWVGAIEFHVKSSDWYRHKHHLDRAYNNVILHVVYLHDKNVEVEGRTLPVVELKPHIDLDHFLTFNKFELNKAIDFPCKKLLNQALLSDLEKMKNQAFYNRLSRKTSNREFDQFESDHSVLLNLTARAFGSSVNGAAFEEIVNNFSLNQLKQHDENTIRLMLNHPLWKHKGLNAGSNPQKRLQQFLDFLTIFDFEIPFWELPASIINLYFEQQFKRAKINSKFILNNFLINCVSRFIFWKGNQQNNLVLTSKSEKLLQLIPKESNRITRKWENLNVYFKNAFDSQALIEIYEQLCTRKACLNCAIGKKILGK